MTSDANISNDQSVSGRLKEIVSKHFTIEYFLKDPHLFEPICVVSIPQNFSQETFQTLQKELNKNGFQVRVQKLEDGDLAELKLGKIVENNPQSKDLLFRLYFETKSFDAEEKAKKQKKPLSKTQMILLTITIFTTIFAGYFYIEYIEPYYRSIASVIIYSACMFLIVFVHEMGHYTFSKRHGIHASKPYLIPGPPPIGMLGAFVSIKSDPQTRNQKFDIAIGGIAFGTVTSLLMLIIGLYFSQQVDTSIYLQFRAEYYGTSKAVEAQKLSKNLNFYNLAFLGIRYLFFEVPSYGNYYGYSLPDKVLLLHPLAYAGWVGLLLSGLNMIPLPFLDGGHLLKAMFKSEYAGFIGILVGFVIFLMLNPILLALSILPSILLCFSQYLMLQSRRDSKADDVLIPIIPLTKSRKIIAACLLPLFILLYPLSVSNLIYGVGI